MSIRIRDRGGQRPLLDIVSLGRRARLGRDRLLPAEVELISRTVRHSPEVMVKVSGGGKSVKAVAAHLRYVDRNGALTWYTDEDELRQGRGTSHALISDWDLAADAGEMTSAYSGAPGRRSAKLVHTLVLSMPRQTPPGSLLAASRAFAREAFGGQYRYAMVLHTDREHPHVHLVVRARDDRDERLRVSRTTLRQWREQFAGQLRAQGIDANATERAVRGECRATKRDAIFRAARRGHSTHVRGVVESVARDINGRHLEVEPGAITLMATRRQVKKGWLEVAASIREARPELAAQVRAFVASMPPPLTQRQKLAAQLHDQIRILQRTADLPVR